MFLFLIEDAKFPLGQVVATPGARVTLVHGGQTAEDFIKRHARGDWGELLAEDCATNERALKHGARLFSRYVTSIGDPLYVITEADRSVNTILVPEEY